MSESSGRPSRLLFALLGFSVLASGGAFFWANLPPSKSNAGRAVALAAPAPKAPNSVARPKPATKAERTAAQKTIASQLRAFDAGNWKEAVKFQSESLKGNFPSPEAFGQMIEQTYPAFINPKKVEYGRALNVGGSIQFEVALTGQDSSVTRAVYLLVKEKGNYRVASVMGGVTARPVNNNADIV